MTIKNYNEILVLGLGGGSVIETLREDFNYQKNITIDNATLSHSQYVKTKKQHILLLILCKWLFLSLDKHILKNRQVAMKGEGTNLLDIGDFIHSVLSKGSVIVLFNFHIASHLFLNFPIVVYQ